MKIACVILAVVTAVLLVWNLPMFPFVPVFHIKEYGHDQEWRRMPCILNEDGLGVVRRSLSDGGETCILARSMHQVLIPLRLLVDTEMLGNYTSKAGLACPDPRFEMDTDGLLWVEKKR